MDLPQLQQWNAEPSLKQSTLDKARLMKRLVGTLAVLIASTFLLMLWVLGAPGTYQQNAAASGPSARWPDGSAKTANDWWAKAKGHAPVQVAQPPRAPSSAPAQPNRG